MHRRGRKLKIEKLIEESEQQVASCRKMLEQSSARAQMTWKILTQRTSLAPDPGAAHPL